MTRMTIPKINLLSVLLISHLLTGSLCGKTFSSRDDFLAATFPGAQIARETVYLTDVQREEAETLSGTKLPSSVVFVYRASTNQTVLGTVYFESHRVRTLPETLAVVVNPDHSIRSVAVLVFKEPEEYRPTPRWYAQFPGHKLDHRLRLKQGIQGVTGATLTSRATTQCARRILSLHQVLNRTDTP
jgi:hypothetical protein